jgi:hypothetical protein
MDLRPNRTRFIALALGLTGVGTACAGDQVGHGYYGAPDEAGATPPSPTSTSTSTSSGGGDASSPPDLDAAPARDGDAATEGGAATPANPSCDMNGRWLVAQRVLAQALGQTQASHNWFYYEVRQDGDQVTVTKGLHCGYEVVHVTALGADVDSHLVWPALLTHNSDTGRKGTMKVTSSGCQLDVEKRYTVRGATVTFYSDPNQSMPTASQQASGTTPGWEDWDADGKPGITLSVSGAASGHLYCAQRDWNQWSGAVAANSTTFSVPATWNSGQDALGYDGSSLVTQSAVPDSDATQHYVWFARLNSTQATGSDTAICTSIRALVPALTPAALK